MRTNHHVILLLLLTFYFLYLGSQQRVLPTGEVRVAQCSLIEGESAFPGLFCGREFNRDREKGVPIAELRRQDLRYALGQSMDVNKARAEDLELIPGIGRKRARAIIEFRQERGGFERLDELQEVRGIGLKTVRKLRLSLHSSSIRQHSENGDPNASSPGLRFPAAEE